MLMCSLYDAECIDKVTESIAVLNMFIIVFAVTFEGLKVWWKSVHTRFGKFTGHHSGDGARELTDRDKYILEKLQFLEMHIACMPSRQTCSVSIKFIHQHTRHFISSCAMCKYKCQYVKLLNAM